MKAINKRLLILSMLGIMDLSMAGCGVKDEAKKQLAIEKEIHEASMIYDEAPVMTAVPEELKEEEVTDSKDMYGIGVETEVFRYITATENVNIRDLEGNIKGVLVAGHTIQVINKLEDGSFLVDYYGEDCTIDGNYVLDILKDDIVTPIQKVMYATSDTTMYIPEYFDVNGIAQELPIQKYECFEIYEEDEDYYVAKTNDYIGFIPKTNLEELTDTFVVVDISDQQLRLYQNNEVTISSPVVTGKPSTPTYKGCFAIYNKTSNRYLILDNGGKGQYVNTMNKFDGGRGLHDAEYITEENGFKHGWRESLEFGGDTYEEHGSHGCVNMPHEEALLVADQIEIGTKVLVKQ